MAYLKQVAWLRVANKQTGVTSLLPHSRPVSHHLRPRKPSVLATLRGCVSALKRAVFLLSSIGISPLLFIAAGFVIEDKVFRIT